MLKEKIKSFAMGAIAATILLCGFSAFSANIEKVLNATFKDIQIFIDGEMIEPKDANGAIVEPFIVDGTTYLPVRALSEALGCTVEWDDERNAVNVSTEYYEYSESGILFTDLFTMADAEHLVNFKRISDENQPDVFLFFDLIEDGRGTEYPSKIRLAVSKGPVDPASGEYDNIISDYYDMVYDDIFLYYDEETGAFITFTLNEDGSITVEEFGDALLSIDGEYEFDRLG